MHNRSMLHDGREPNYLLLEVLANAVPAICVFLHISFGYKVASKAEIEMGLTMSTFSTIPKDFKVQPSLSMGDPN